MSSKTSLILVFVFLILEYRLAFAWMHDSSCGTNGKYTNNGVYATNLNKLLSSLSTNVDRYGFYNASVGNSPDRVNAIVLCKGDIQLDMCRKCIQNATFQILQSCPNQMDAVFWDPDCMVRYSNEVIIGIMETSPAYHSWWNAYQYGILSDLRTLVNDITAKAASSLHKVAAGMIKSANFQTIYALVQCTPDLTQADCTKCLLDTATDMSICCSASIGVHMYAPSCVLFYELHPFFNQSRLQELGFMMTIPADPASSPSPSSPVPKQPSSTSPHSSDGHPSILIIVVSIAAIIGLVTLVSYLKRRNSPPSRPGLSGIFIYRTQ